MTHAAYILKAYNDWRRGADSPQPSPREIGVAIDSIIDENIRIKIENDGLRSELDLLRKTSADYAVIATARIEGLLAEVESLEEQRSDYRP